MSRRKILTVLLFPFILIFLIASTCTVAPEIIDGNFKSDVTLDKSSYKFDSLNIPAGVTVSLTKDTEITIAGVAIIDGNLASAASKLTLEISGDFTLNGKISVAGKPLAVASQADESETSFKNQSEGLYIIAKGKITTGQNSKINSITPMVLTDDATELNKTPKQVDEEANTTSGDLPTFLPLPADVQANNLVNKESSISTLAAIPLTVSGRWDFSARPGDKPIHVRFNGADRDIIFNNWTLIPPVGVAGKDAKKDSAKDAKASNGKRGMNLNIYNNGGSISLNKTVINVPSGGDGGNATAVCATATAGDGGKAGNFRMTAKNGIDFGTDVTINIGTGGDGGNATVTGNGECDVKAVAGKGAENKKKLFIRGSVQGLANLSLGDVKAGNGGNATASTLAKAPSGQSCGDAGKDGGNAIATAGHGADASFKTNSAQITAPSVVGGDAGNASSKAGNGGDGGDCAAAGPGGKGGDGGTATAKAGNGGKGSTSSGKAANADAVAGTAGRGGHACGTPPDKAGKGGNGGDASATAGTAGDGSTKGTSTGMAGDGGKGGDGNAPGAGGSKGIGSGSPTKVADGNDGKLGDPCPTANKVKITVQKSGGGEGNVVPNPTPSSQSGNQYIFPKDTDVVFTANADAGSVFVSWSGCDSVVDNKCTLKANNDKTITVTFDQESTDLKQAYIDFSVISQGSIPDDSSYCLPLLDPQTKQVIQDYSVWATFDWNPPASSSIGTQSFHISSNIQVLRNLIFIIVAFECINKTALPVLQTVSLDSKAICNQNKCTSLSALDKDGKLVAEATNNAPNTVENITLSPLTNTVEIVTNTINIVEFLAAKGFLIKYQSPASGN